MLCSDFVEEEVEGSSIQEAIRLPSPEQQNMAVAQRFLAVCLTLVQSFDAAIDAGTSWI